MCVCVCVCVRACVRACVRVCVCVREEYNIMFIYYFWSFLAHIFVDLVTRGMITLVNEVRRYSNKSYYYNYHYYCYYILSRNSLKRLQSVAFEAAAMLVWLTMTLSRTWRSSRATSSAPLSCRRSMVWYVHLYYAVPSPSTLQTFQDASHLRWFRCPPVSVSALLSPLTPKQQ